VRHYCGDKRNVPPGKPVVFSITAERDEYDNVGRASQSVGLARRDGLGSPSYNDEPDELDTTVEVRRLMPARDDALPLYIKEQGATLGKSGESYHISTGETISIRSLIEIICELTNRRFDQLVEPVGERLGKDQAYLLDSGKVRSELGWRDSIPLANGLQETLAWIDANFATLKSLPSDYIHKA